MYTGLIVLGIFFVLGIAALVFFIKKSDRAHARIMQSYEVTPNPVKRDKV
jgi:hypothetical protein